MKKKKLALFAVITCCLCFMFICFAADYTQAGGPGKLTVFASDPDYGVVGMYREGAEHIYFEVKSKTDGGKVATSAKFHDNKMNVIAESGSNSAAAYTPAATRNHQNMVSLAAGELQKHASLNHDVFIHEKGHLTDFQDLYSNRSLGKRELKAAAAGVTPANRALKAKNYFQGKHKDMKWNRASDGVTLTGNYLGTTFHYNHKVFHDAVGDLYHPGQPRTERNARITSATGKNIVAEFGGHWVPEGYDVGPKEEDSDLGKKGNDSLENLENHHKAVGEGFMAGRVINSKDDFPAKEKEIFNRIGSNLYENILPRKDDDQEVAAATGFSAMLTAMATSAKDMFTQSKAMAANSYSTNLELWWHGLVWPAQHSATIILYYWRIGSGAWMLSSTRSYCNHGSCARAGDMNYKCTAYSGSMSGYRYIPYYGIPTHDVGAPGWHSCTSDYNMAPYNQYHVCNDDSWTQIRAIKGESYCINPGCGQRCGDWTARPGAPACSD